MRQWIRKHGINLFPIIHMRKSRQKSLIIQSQQKLLVKPKLRFTQHSVKPVDSSLFCNGKQELHLSTLYLFYVNSFFFEINIFLQYLHPYFIKGYFKSFPISNGKRKKNCKSPESTLSTLWMQHTLFDSRTQQEGT